MPDATTTDLYEVTMAMSYRREGMTGPATFSLFVRDIPPDRGSLVAAGLESSLDWLRSPEPWAGYDTMDLYEITDRLNQVPSSTAWQVLEYERYHLQRQRVISAAETRIPE